MGKIEQYNQIGKVMINCILKENGKKATEENRMLLIKYIKIFTSLAGIQNVQECHFRNLFDKFLETVMNKFEDAK